MAATVRLPLMWNAVTLSAWSFGESAGGHRDPISGKEKKALRAKRKAERQAKRKGRQ